MIIDFTARRRPPSFVSLSGRMPTVPFLVCSRPFQSAGCLFSAFLAPPFLLFLGPSPSHAVVVMSQENLPNGFSNPPIDEKIVITIDETCLAYFICFHREVLQPSHSIRLLCHAHHVTPSILLVHPPSPPQIYPGASFRALRHEFIPYLQSETKHHLRNFHAGHRRAHI